MAQAAYNDVVETARSYYNSDDADNFYYHIWGGEDIHVGTYENEDDTISQASRRTVERMATQSKNLNKDSYVLDVGAGYGGAARYLAHKYGCKVVALNLSEKENERDRQMNAEQGLDHLIEVVDASFEDIPFDDNTFDLVWSQDAILHSGDREKVISEVSRVLKKGGEFIFTDPMMSDNCSLDVLGPILARIQLSTLGSPAFYRKACTNAGMREETYIDCKHQLPEHYSNVLAQLETNESSLEGKVSKEYIENMKKGLRHWINGGNEGNLAWGIFHFVK